MLTKPAWILDKITANCKSTIAEHKIVKPLANID